MKFTYLYLFKVTIFNTSIVMYLKVNANISISICLSKVVINWINFFYFIDEEIKNQIMHFDVIVFLMSTLSAHI